MVSTPTPEDEQNSQELALLNFAESFSARGHPLREEEYETAAKHILELIDDMTCMDDMDSPFETVYELCYQHASSTVTANLLAQYSIRSREIGYHCANARLREAEQEIASLKSRREEILLAEQDARISAEEGKTERVAINRKIDDRIRDLDILRVLLEKANGDLKYARGKGRYPGHSYPQTKSSPAQPVNRPPSVISIPDDPSNAPTCAESFGKESNVESPSDTPPRKRRNRGSPNKGKRVAPQPEKDDECSFAVAWPGSCDRCTKHKVPCVPASAKNSIRCLKCSEKTEQCLFNGINVNGEVKVGRKVMGVYNGLGISFPVRITKSEREKAEKRVREVLANWRPPLSVNQAELDVKLRNYSPTGPAITVFLYPPPVEKSASEPEPPSTPVRARDVVHGKRHASETDDDPPIPPTPEASSQRPIAGSTRVASKIRLEKSRVVSDAPPSSPSHPAEHMSGVVSGSASPLGEGSDAPAPSTITSSTAGPSTAGSSRAPVPVRDRLVAALRLRYNEMVAEYTAISLQLTSMRHEEEKLTGMAFGTYVSPGMYIEQPYPVWEDVNNGH